MKTFQNLVGGWMRETFTDDIVFSKKERNNRLIEEAIELVQAAGMEKEKLLKIVDYVYSRPTGDIDKEVGGLMITLAALCNVHKIDISDQGYAELQRINTPERISSIRLKQQQKQQAGISNNS